MCMGGRPFSEADKADHGFSLLELLIVVTILLIISVIAIPGLLRSRQLANETVAVSNMRVLATAQLTYSSSNGGIYGTIPDVIAQSLVDTRFTTGTTGYEYSVTLSPDSLSYLAEATATAPSFGRYDYYASTDFIVRYSDDSARAPVGLAGEPVR